MNSSRLLVPLILLLTAGAGVGVWILVSPEEEAPRDSGGLTDQDREGGGAPSGGVSKRSREDVSPRPIETTPRPRAPETRPPAPPSAARQLLESLRENPRAARLSGRVLDPEGEGIEGATISVREDLGGRLEVAFGGEEVARLSSDEEGAFALDPGPLVAGRRYLLHVTHRDFAPTRVHPVDPLRPASLVQEVRLGAGQRLAGTVKGADGAAPQPLAGAEVLVWAADRRGPGGEARELEARSRTGADGGFVLAGLLPGAKQVEVRATGRATHHAPTFTLGEGESRDDLAFILRAGGQLEGQVVAQDGGAGVQGARIAVRGLASGTADDPATRAREVTSDAGGRFRIEGLPLEALLIVEVTAPGAQRAVRQNARAGQTDLVIAVSAPARLEGHVVAADDGEPVNGFTLSLSMQPEAIAGSWNLRRRVSDANGRFSVPAARRGSWYLVAEAPGFVPGVTGPIDIPGSGRVSGLEIRLERGAAILGKVVDRRGHPVLGAKVTLQQRISVPKSRLEDLLMKERDVTRAEALTFVDGSFLLPGAGNGRFRVTVDSAEHAPAETEFFEVTGSGEFPVGEIAVGPPAVLEGRVLDSAGRPDATASVLLTDTSRPRASRSVATDREGRFRVERLRPGRYVVRLSRSGGRYRFNVGGAAGEVVQQTVDLGEGQVLNVELKDR